MRFGRSALAIAAILLMITACGGSSSATPPAPTSAVSGRNAEYAIHHLPELAQYRTTIIGLDQAGDILADVYKLITVHHRLVSYAPAILDLHPGTARAKVIKLLPLPAAAFSEEGIGINASGTVVVQAGAPWHPYVGKLLHGVMHWSRLAFKPEYGSGTAAGIAADGVVAGEIHGLIRKPHCCTSLQQAVIWVPQGSGYSPPIFLHPALSEATAIWNSPGADTVTVAGIVDPRLAIWTLSVPGCSPPGRCPGSSSPVLGPKVGGIYSGNAAIQSMVGSGATIYGSSEEPNYNSDFPFGTRVQLKRRSGRFEAGPFLRFYAPTRLQGALCTSGPWAVAMSRRLGLIAVSGGACRQPCPRNSPVGCMIPEHTNALLWRRGRSVSLNSLISAHTRWWLKDANAINAAGSIAGTAWFGRKTVPFLLTPTHR